MVIKQNTSNSSGGGRSCAATKARPITIVYYILCKSLDTYLLPFTYTRTCIYRPTRERWTKCSSAGTACEIFRPRLQELFTGAVCTISVRVCVRVHSVRNSSALRIIIIYICVQRRLGLDHVNKMVCADHHHHRLQLLTEHTTDRKICFVSYYNTI